MSSFTERQVISKQDALDALRVIKWLNAKRYESGRVTNYRSSSTDDPETEVLAYWLTYITDRVMPAKDVWDMGYPVFEFWAESYLKMKHKLLEELGSYFVKVRGNDGEEKFRFKGKGESSFASRFPKKDYECVRRTLSILSSHYDSSFCKFFVDLIGQHRKKKDFIRRIACSLFLLTYETGVTEGQAANFLKDSDEFENYFSKWQKKSNDGKKRLWASLRDYVKTGSSINGTFLKMLERSMTSDIRDFWASAGTEFAYLNQLELPGDVWNENATFRSKLLVPIAKCLGSTEREESTAEMVRKICQKANDVDPYLQICPEEFDVTYSFVPKMCDSEENSEGMLCRNLCPFGEVGATRVCVENSEYNVPVLVLTGYLTQSKIGDEIIKNGKGKGTCLMIT